MPRWFCDMWEPKLLLIPKMNVWPKNGHFCPEICFLGYIYMYIYTPCRPAHLVRALLVVGWCAWAALSIEHLPTLISTKMALNMKDFQGERMTKYDQSHRMVFFVGASLLRSLAAGWCLLVATDSLSFLFFWVHAQHRQQQHLSFENGQRHYISSFLIGIFSQ